MDQKKLSANQALFVRAATRAGFEVRYDYSGRGMFGDRCPAITLERGREFRTRARVKVDSLGLDSVVYAAE